MATSEIESSVTHITGASTTEDIVKDAQKFVSSSIPKELMWAYASKTAGVIVNPVTDNTTLIHTDNILGVDRDGFAARKTDFSQKGFLGASSGSLLEPTKKYPKWIIAETNEISVFPIPVSGEEGSVLYVNYANIGDTSDLRNAVIYRACAIEFTKLGRSELVDWTDAIRPQPPVLEDNSLAFSDITGDAPTYIAPVISLTDFPSIAWIVPSVPIASSTSVQSVEAFENVPTFLPPAMGHLDFTDTDVLIDGGDPEMLQARVQEIQAKVSEFSAKLSEVASRFNQENTIFQADVQKKIQEAQLKDAQEAKILQKYQGEVSAYQAEVNTVVQSNQSEIAEWQTRNSLSIQQYGTDIQNELNKFNQENSIYQAELQVLTQSAQVTSQDDSQKIQDYSAKIQEYSSQVNEIVSKTGSAQQSAAFYSAEAKKYYDWALQEVATYVKNNSTMLGKTMSLQAQQQRS